MRADRHHALTAVLPTGPGIATDLLSPWVWYRVSLTDPPERGARPLAPAIAQREHTALIWGTRLGLR